MARVMDKISPQPKLLARIFLSPDESRLRAGWRLIAQTLLQYLLVFVAVIVAMLAMPSNRTANPTFLDFFAYAAPVVLSIYIARRYFDKRSFASLGLKRDRRAWQHLWLGIGIASLLMLLIFLTELAAGWLQFEGFIWQQPNWTDNLPQFLEWGLIWLVVGFYEELLSRGYHLQNLEDGLNKVWAVLLSSAYFGMLHFTNPYATWVSTLGITVIAFWLAYAYLHTRSLWLPIGIHIGWNFFQGTIFGFPVSGLTMPHLLHHTPSGPTLFTGGDFGPEAGLIVLPALAIGAILVWRIPPTLLQERESDGKKI